MKKGTLLGLLVGLLIVGIVYASMSITYKNQEVELRTAIEKKQKMDEAAFDKMWKNIAQTAEVADKYQGDFRGIYKDIMDARYKGGGGDGDVMFSFLKEHNPELSTDLYNKLSNTITAERAGFYERQNELSSISQEHTTLLRTFPGSWFLSDFDEIEIVIVTSTKTEEVFKTGKEDDVKLF